ncbi:MAG TPA: glycosyltransferase [Solirubrobacteraceae bacterium]|nr:glycosyltransferase [Solirubrobacteraceae bacterium]
MTILTYRKRERLSARSQFPAARFVEWQEWPLVGRVGSLNNLLQPSYAGFYLHARRWIRAAEVRNEHFDIVHQLTPMALRYPSPAAGLVPRLVVGPMAGALPTPPGFRAEMAASPWYTKLRRVDQWRFRHDPVLRRSMSAASVVIGAATYVRDVLGDVPLRRFEVMNELGVDELPPMPKRPSRPPGQLRALFVGRIIRSKGLRDAIRAWSSLEGLPHVTLDVVGEGEDRAACETEARQLGVSGRVRFHGWLARSEVNRLYGESDMFVFPSFREPTGGVIIEAMSFGLPVVTAQYGGPAELVNDESGVRVPPIAPEQYARALAAAVARLASDPRAREAQGLAARRRVETQFLWSTKLTWLEDLYGELLESELTVAH